MDSSKKLVGAVLVLAGLGGALAMQNKTKNKDAKAHSYDTKQADLPKVELSEETLKAVDQIELELPAKTAGDKGAGGVEVKESKPAEKIVLKKASEEHWNVVAPMNVVALASNVKSALDSVKQLKFTDTIASSKDAYDRWGVSDAKAVHVVFKKGADVALDLYIGEDGSRGLMVRLGNKEGVFAAKGLSKFQFSRELRDWRDRTVLHFDEADAVRVNIQNENGTFEFKKAESDWSSSFKGTKGAAKPVDKFKTSKLEDLLRAYRSLSAADFGDEKKPSEVGLEPPHATLTIETKDGKQHTVFVGDTAEGTNRWARVGEGGSVFSVGSWSADWALAAPSKFQDTPASKADSSPKGPEGGMPGMPGMPMGHPMPRGH